MTYDPAYSYPGSDPNRQPGDGTIPVSLRRAVQLMYVGAGLMALSVILMLVGIAGTRGEADQALDAEASRLGVDPSQLQAAFGAVIVFIVIVGVGFVGLWIWMAIKNRQGRNWARVTSTVFFGLFSLFVLLSLGGGDPIGALFGIVIWLVGLGALIFMWRGDSTDYYQRAKAGGQGPGMPPGPGMPGPGGYGGQPGQPGYGGSYPPGGTPPPHPRQPPG